MDEKEDRKLLLKKALDLLSRREHAAGELQSKLAVRGYPEAHIDDVLTYLFEKNYLNDKRFAESYLRMRSHKGYGERDIRSNLLRRGVSKTEIDGVLRSAEVDWFDLAHTALQKKFGSKIIDPDDSMREKARAARFLHTRGFTTEQAYHAVTRVMGERTG